ncbi:MAG: DNA repair protein RecO [Patescibacteria group bacterium]
MSHLLHHSKAITLSTRAFGEGSLLCFLLTENLGLIPALSQGAREQNSKLRAHLQPLALIEASFVKGKNGWRLTHAQEEKNFYTAFQTYPILTSLWMRVFSLLSSLVAGEEENNGLFSLVEEALRFSAEQLPTSSDINSFEQVLVLRILENLGYIPSSTKLDLFSRTAEWSPSLLSSFRIHEKEALRAINESLGHSGLASRVV